MNYQPYFPHGVPSYSFPHGEARYEKGQNIPPMVHAIWDLIYIQEGEVIWEFKDGTIAKAKPGEFLLLPPYVPVSRPPAKSLIRFCYCHFYFRINPNLTGGLKTKILYETIVQQDALGPGTSTPIPVHFSEAEAPKVLAAYENLFAIKHEASDRFWRFERAIIELVSEIGAFARQKQRTSKQSTQSVELTNNQDPRIRRICYRIDDEPTYNWKVGEIAKSAGITVGHLNLLCQRTMGKSLKEYIIEARVKRAMELLKDAQPDGKMLTIKQVSEQCGFASQHFFSRQFKQTLQMTPQEYRESYLSMNSTITKLLSR